MSPCSSASHSFAYPLVYSAYLSLHSYDLLSPPRWVGLANYRYLFQDDPEVGTAVRNTLWLIVIAVPLQVLFAFGIAVMVTRAKRGVGLFRTIFYLPALAPPVAAALGFVYLLNPATGPVNIVLDKLGIEGPLWFNDPGWSKPSLTLLAMWGVGTIFVIFLASPLTCRGTCTSSSRPRGALRRLRYSPADEARILFGAFRRISLQYFTQAYVRARSSGRLRRRDGQHSRAGYPECSTLFYPISPTTASVLQHGLRLGVGELLLAGAFVVTLISPQLRAGCLLRSGSVSDLRHRTVRAPQGAAECAAAVLIRSRSTGS